MLAEDISQEVFYHLYEIMDTLDLNKDGEDVHMAYGTIVNELKEVSRS